MFKTPSNVASASTLMLQSTYVEKNRAQTHQTVPNLHNIWSQPRVFNKYEYIYIYMNIKAYQSTSLNYRKLGPKRDLSEEWQALLLTWTSVMICNQKDSFMPWVSSLIGWAAACYSNKFLTGPTPSNWGFPTSIAWIIRAVEPFWMPCTNQSDAYITYNMYKQL